MQNIEQFPRTHKKNRNVTSQNIEYSRDFHRNWFWFTRHYNARIAESARGMG